MVTQATVRKDWLSAAAYAGMFVFGIVMALLGALLPLLADRARFDMAQAGGLFLVMNFCMLVSMLGLGPLVDRFGKRFALAGGSTFVAIALLLIGLAGSYQALLWGVVLLGAGGGALNAITNLLVSDLHADARRKAAALNLLGIFFGFGAMLLPLLVGSLVADLGLGRIMYIAVGLSLAPAVLFVALAFPPPVRQQAFRLSEAAALIGKPLILLLGFVLFFQSGNEFIIGGYTSVYLTRNVGLSFSRASYLLAGYWAAIMFGRVVTSRLLLGMSGLTLVLISALGSAFGVSILLLAPGPIGATAAIIIIGLSFASIFPTTLGIAGSKFETYSGTAFGILFAIALTGGMILPWAVGQITDAHGLRVALILALLNSLMIFLLQLILRRSKNVA